jgi:hypothetical protein
MVAILGAAALAVDRSWFSDPDLSVGSRHHVTIRVIHPCENKAFAFTQIPYAGRVWWIAGQSDEEAGISVNPPSSGTLLITGPSPGATNAVLLLGNKRIRLEGGRLGMPVECGIH